MFEKIEPGIKVLVCDVDNTLVNLRADGYGSILNADLLIPILQFASLLKLPLAIDTARDQWLDHDISSNGAVSVADLLLFMREKNIPFCTEGPNLIVMSKDVVEIRSAYMKQYTPQDNGWGLYVKEKNPDLRLILQRINELRVEEERLKPEDLLILDDSESIVNQARMAGFKAILVPLDFAPKASGTRSVDYLYELASLLGLSAYAEGLEQNPEQYEAEPERAVAVARQYLEAKTNRNKNIKPVDCLVHPELENLVALIEREPKTVYRVLKKFRYRGGFQEMIDELRVIDDSILLRTALGVAILKNNFLVLRDLLKLRASPNQFFDLDDENRAISPLAAAILLNCDVEILLSLLQAGARFEVGNRKESILELAFVQFCRNTEKGLALESYYRLNILVCHLQACLDSSVYLKHLYPLFPQIMRQRDPVLLSIFIIQLSSEHRRVLFTSLMKEKEFKGLVLSALKLGDEFSRHFLLNFHLQEARNLLKIYLQKKPFAIWCIALFLSKET